MKKLITEEFITKAKIIHGNEYDYSLVDYVNSYTKVKIICSKHGNFEQQPSNHLSRQGCPECGKIIISKKRSSNTNEFIQKAVKIHGYKYDYSLVEYINDKTKVKITCKEHGVFEQTPNNHLYKKGCKRCFVKSRSYDKKIFVEKAKEIHGNKYDYFLVNYINAASKVNILCHKHGEFQQTPNSHLNGYGCKKCALETVSKKLSFNKDIFLKKCKVAHGEKYDYSLVEYKNSKIKVKIICPIHGIFLQKPLLHVAHKIGCKKCSVESTAKKLTMPRELFLENANKAHNNKYDYSLSKYVNSATKIIIICPEHGEFMQTPDSHIIGKNRCPICKSSKGEIVINNFLEENNIKFTPQKRFKDCRHILTLPFDFFLPLHNICIEYDGELHFKAVKHYGGEEKLQKTQINDKIKTEYCKTNNIQLLRITYKEIKKIDTILNQFLKNLSCIERI